MTLWMGCPDRPLFQMRNLMRLLSQSLQLPVSVLVITKCMKLFSTNQVQVFSVFQGSRRSIMFFL